MLSCTLNKAIARAIFDSLYYSAPAPHSPLDEATVLSEEQVSSALRNASSPYGLRLFPFPATATPAVAPVSTQPPDPPVPGTSSMRELFAGSRAGAPAAPAAARPAAAHLREPPLSSFPSLPPPNTGGGRSSVGSYS